jgi:hypothetical protein
VNTVKKSNTKANVEKYTAQNFSHFISQDAAELSAAVC